jgi:hypothetical protein
MTTTDTADGHLALPPPKKRKVYQTEFTTAHRACRTHLEREQLAEIIQAGWTEAELHEYARLFFFPNKKDYPTALSYRRAIEDVAGSIKWMSMRDVEPGYYGPIPWLKLFRRGKSKPLPPRRTGMLLRGRGLTHRISADEYSWPGHTEEYRSMIEQRCRDYFKIAPDQPVHVNAWSASQRAYGRECYAEAEKERIATEAVTLVLSPKFLKKSQAKKSKAPRRSIVSSYDCGDVYDKLKPHFNYEFPGHTPAFLEEVAALARKDRGMRPDAPISPGQWKITCNKNYYLIERPKV